MKIVQLVPGSGDRFYCENCARDDGLVRGLRELGHDVTVVPLYLPLTSEYGDVPRDAPIFYGAVSLYVRHVLPSAPRWVERILDSPALLGVAGHFAGSTEAGELGGLTISMLEGEDGRQSEELDRLVGWLSDVRPDVVHLSNGLLIGMAGEIRRRLDVPVVCSLQDEHTWIDGFADAGARERAWSLFKERAADVDLFLPVSRYYADYMMRRLGLSGERMRIVPVGIDPGGYPEHREPGAGRTIGYLSNISRGMGFGLLAEAFAILKSSGDFDDLTLAAAGGHSDPRYFRSIIKELERTGVRDDVSIVPSFHRHDRIRFLSGLTVLSVPVLEGEAFGTFILESLAAGVPVVQPRLGGFPEVVEATGGGVLYDPNTPDALAREIGILLGDPERMSAMGRAGRESVRASFTLGRMAEGFAAAYRSCIGNKEGEDE